MRKVASCKLALTLICLYTSLEIPVTQICGGCNALHGLYVIKLPYLNSFWILLFFQTKISLQLYQVDHKSYLLDFKSLALPSNPQEMSYTGELSRRSSANSSCSSLKDYTGHSSEQLVSPSVGHHTLDFLEMCSNLIIALACWGGFRFWFWLWATGIREGFINYCKYMFVKGLEKQSDRQSMEQRNEKPENNLQTGENRIQTVQCFTVV